MNIDHFWRKFIERRSGLAMKGKRIRSSGFTLVEILAAMTLVLVLAWLLLPVLKRSLERQKQVVCLSQMRRVHQAVMAYASETGYFPPTSGGVVGESWGWWYQEDSPLAELGGGKQAWSKITICPLNRTAEVITSKSHVKGYPYAANYNVMPTAGSYTIRVPASVPNMSDILLMSDSSPGSDWGWGFDNTDPSKPTGGGSGGWARLSNAHQKKANLLWCDGHVTWQALETLVPKNSLNKNLIY
jgi:prepilin-type processing-associated H-X9-DG protein/prepilin-type N-terminal cleavage/methylation domain-containing protein